MSEFATPADPQDVARRWQAAMVRGDWEAAWQQTDRIELPRRRAQREPGFIREPHHLVWDGRAPDGLSVLVRCLHGLGDTLMFMRYVPALAARARALHFLVQPALLDLLQGAPGLGAVSNAWTDQPPAHELEMEVMELAYAARSTTATVPPPYPFLARQLGNRRHALPLGEDDGALRVALFWACSHWGNHRSLPLAALEPLFSLPGVRFHSMQQGPAAQDALAERFGLVPLWRHTEAIADAAAAMLAMDLVITVDAMPAHLAGTLGRPTWLMLLHEADWRWMQGRADSPWYPSMRLFRQPRPGDWDGAVAELRGALARMAEVKSTAHSAA